MLFLYRKHLFVKTETFNINIKTMAKIVTLGEIMLRLSSPGQKRFVQIELLVPGALSEFHGEGFHCDLRG